MSTSLNATDEDNLVALLATREVPFQSPSSAFSQAAQTLVGLYPDNPSAGSPFDTGDNTFGLNPEFKRMSAVVGDFEYQALRRAWSVAASGAGLRNYAYLFAVPDARNGGQLWLGGETIQQLLSLYNLSSDFELQ